MHFNRFGIDGTALVVEKQRELEKEVEVVVAASVETVVAV